MAGQSYGEWLRHNRQGRNITQKMIEGVTGISVSHLSRIENGRIRLPEKETRDAIHEMFGTSDEDLVDAGILVKFQFPYDGYEPVYMDPSVSSDDESASVATSVIVVSESDLTQAEMGVISAIRQIPDMTQRDFDVVLAQLDWLRKAKSGTL